MADEQIHAVYKAFKSDIRWHDFREVGAEEDYYDWYYAENRLYIIRDRLTEQYYFVEAKSPAEALQIMNEHFHEATDFGCGGDGDADIS